MKNGKISNNAKSALQLSGKSKKGAKMDQNVHQILNSKRCQNMQKDQNVPKRVKGPKKCEKMSEMFLFSWIFISEKMA